MATITLINSRSFQLIIFMKDYQKVLIVEDDFLQAYLMEKIVETLGFKSLGNCATGEEAVEVSKVSKPNLILMDINLAGKIDGIEAVKQIQKEIHSTIIYISGNSDHIKRAEETSYSTFLVKPISKKILKDTLADISF